MRTYIRILLIAVLPAFSMAQTTTWIAGSSNWNNINNWDTGIPLTAGYTAVIDSSGNTVTLDTNPSIDALNLNAGTLTIGAQTLTLAAPSTSIAPLTMGSATLNVNNDGSNSANGALIFTLGGTNSTYSATGNSSSVINVNSGTIAINDNGGGNTLSLTGGGQINLAYNGASAVPATITGVSGFETLTTDFNISGQGLVTNLALNLSGTVDSNIGGVLDLQASAGGLTNNGTLQASNGTLALDTTNGGAIVNNGTINAGVFPGAGSVILFAMNGTTSLTNNGSGTINVNDGSSFFISGTGSAIIQNNGAFNLNSNGDSTTLNLAGNGTTFTFTGSGSLNLSDSSGNLIVGSTGGETLVNDVNHTIQGAGFIGNLSLTNNGNIGAGTSGGNPTFNSLTIMPSAGGFTNNGTVTVGTGGLTIDTSYGNVANSSTGTINVNGGAMLTVYSQGLGGTIQNNGSINLNYDSVAGAPSNLQFESYSGTFTLSGTGSLTMADLPGEAQAGAISGVTGSETLVNGAGHTLNAAGSIAGLSLVNNGTLDVTGVNVGVVVSNSDLINYGTVSVNGAGLTYVASGYNFDNEGTLAVNSSSVTIADPFGYGQTIVNNGSITLTNSQLALQSVAFGTSTFELSGTGTLTLGGAGSSIAGSSLGGGSVTLLNDQGQTIQGSGSIGNLTLYNAGSIVATGGSLTISNLGNYSTGTLTGGSYTSTAGSPLIIQNLGPIQTIGASTSITLNGAGSMITADGITDALTQLTDNEGSLTLSGGRSLTLSGISTFTNNGSIEVDAGSTFNTTAGAFQSLNTSGTLAGNYNVGGTFLFTPQAGSNGFIATIGTNSSVTLNGASSLITFNGTTDALTQLSTNNGSLTLSGDRSLTLSGISTFTNNGSITVAPGSVFNTSAGVFQSLDASGNLSGNYNIGGTFQYTAQGSSGYISAIGSNGSVTLNGAGSLITFDGSTDAMTQLSTNNGSLTLTGGRSLTLSGITTFSNNGSLEVDAGSTFDTRAGAFQNVDTNGNLTGGYNIGGTFQYTPQAGAAGITSIDVTSSLTLAGAGQILYGSGAGTNALANLATNNGFLTLSSGANLSVSGAFSNTFFGVLTLNGASSFTANGALTNTGFVYADGVGTTLTAQGYYGGNQSALSGNYSVLSVTNGAVANLQSGTLGGFQNLVNEGGKGTLIDGVYTVGGTLDIDAANDGSGNPLGINAIASSASLTLSGAGQILYGAGSNALAQLSENRGLLSLVDGATLSVSSFKNVGSEAVTSLDGIGTNLTVNGSLVNGNQSLIQMTNGATMQVTGATTMNGELALSGFDTKFAGQGGLTVGSGGSILLVNGATADFRTNGGFNTFTNLGAGTLSVAGALADGVLTGGSYGINGNFLYDSTTGGANGQILGIAAGTQLALVGNGQILTGPGLGTNALALLQENDGVFELLGAVEFTTPGTGVFENAGGGSLLLETGALFATNVQNDGSVYIDPESAIFTNTYTQESGITTVDGAIEAPVDLTGGTLNGQGEVVGDVTQSGGTLQPGDAPGILTVNGNYMQTSGVLEIDFTGVDPGDWGVLDVTGSADLAGELDVVFQNSIAFQAGDVFDVLNANSLTNGGEVFNLPSPGSGLEWAEVFQPGQLDLDVVAIGSTPEPATWLILAIGLALMMWRRRNLLALLRI